MYEVFFDFLPLLILILMGINFYPVQMIDNDEQRYYMLSRNVSISVILALLADTVRNLFF